MKARDIETKLAAARTRLILDKPFLGALVMRLPMLAADPKWCKTTATDARSFYYNRAYIDSLSLAQTQFILAHEALHCALSHFARRQHRQKHRWDVACDLAINPLLIADGLQHPPGALFNESFEGMTAEEIYPSIGELEDREPMDQHLYDDETDSSEDKPNYTQTANKSRDGQTQESNEEQQGNTHKEPQQPTVPPEANGECSDQDELKPENQSATEENEKCSGAPQPRPLNDAERAELSVQWQQRLAGAAQQAMQAGKMGDTMARLVDHLLQPQLPWRMLLARYMTALGKDDYSFQRPSRREGSAILPSLRSNQVNIVVITDTSGSISDGEINEFVSEINAIKGQISARITLHGCDEHLCEQGPWVCEAWEAFEVPDKLQGGGGTSFIPPFEWVEQQAINPDLLVYFTDADGPFPKYEANYPVIWLVKGKKPTPWGTRIQLN